MSQWMCFDVCTKSRQLAIETLLETMQIVFPTCHTECQHQGQMLKTTLYFTVCSWVSSPSTVRTFRSSHFCLVADLNYGHCRGFPPCFVTSLGPQDKLLKQTPAPAPEPISLIHDLALQ